jgi:hypothetical protein
VFSSKTRLDSLKLSPIGTNGKLIPAPPYSTGSPTLLTWTSSNPVGINGGEILPLQVSCVASHRTPQLGRHGRGRMFLPPFTGSATDGHGHLSSGTTASIAAAQAALLTSLTYSSSSSGGPHLAPIITGHPWTNYARINQVRVGNVLDTQRRRRRSLPETYSNVSV